MRRSLVILAVLFAAPAGAQTIVSFECYPAGPLPLDPTGTCAGVVSNGLGGSTGQTGVTTLPNCAFPTDGTRYARLDANGPVAVPGGGPFPWPVSDVNSPAEIRIPIPPSSTTISFEWEFFNSEGIGSSTFNDGMAVGVVDAAGALVLQLAYADNQAPYSGCVDIVSGWGIEVLPSGIQTFMGALPPLTGCEYVSIVCWNGADNQVSSVAMVDNIVFDTAGTPCPVACFPGSSGLSFTSPGGPGCLRALVSGMPPNGTYFLAATPTAGSFPQGWFHGVDIAFSDLVQEIIAGFPFSGPLNSCGSTIIGQFCGVPSGLSLYFVALGIPGPTLGPWTKVSPAVNYVVP